MTTRTRRTPEQLAAYHQRKANQARAKAKKMAKDAKIREQIELGKAAQAAGLSGPAELQAMVQLGRVLAETGKKGGRLNVSGQFHFAAVKALAEGHDLDTDTKGFEDLANWWQASGHPMGPERA